MDFSKGRGVKEIAMAETTKYDFGIGLSKVVKYFVLFALPQFVDWFIIAYPEAAQLTVGAILVGLVNWLKIKFDLKWL